MAPNMKTARNDVGDLRTFMQTSKARTTMLAETALEGAA